jgi:hypothetical protein
MIFEWRTYRFATGAAAAYLSVFQREGLPFVTRHLPLLGYWLTEAGQLNVLHHLWVYADLDDRAASPTALAADTEWSGGPRAFPMIEGQDTLLLVLRRGSRTLSEAVATARGPREAVADGTPLLATSWAILEIPEEEPVGPPAAEATGLWQVVAGRGPANYVGLFRSENAAEIGLGTRPALLCELIRPTVFSPLR